MPAQSLQVYIYIVRASVHVWQLFYQQLIKSHILDFPWQYNEDNTHLRRQF